MLLFLITCCFSFILFHKSLNLNSLPSWAFEMRLLSPWFWKDFLILPIITNSIKTSILALSSSFSSSRMLLKKKSLSNTSKVESIYHIASASSSELSILDLPDLVLECILEKLPPEGLCRMATVCSSLRDRCTSDHLWERHMKNKWGRIVGISAFKHWKCHVDSRKGSIFGGEMDQSKGLLRFLAHLRSFALIRSSFISNIRKKKSDFLFNDSIMSFYLALESGKFWFPAQVYNRENGHVGFLLSCYDAELNYDRKTDTFQARYPPHGRRASPIESGITWDRIRTSPVDTSPLDLHVSDCLNELQPGDQIEIQWRRNKEFPYGWWYGVVGHLETCEGNAANYCRCRDSETLVLEFNQYTRGSRWRTTTVNRKDHREEGNEVDGFYGGIREIRSSEQKSMWQKLWPVDILE